MFCERCGARNDGNSEYCAECGAQMARNNAGQYNQNGYSSYQQNYGGAQQQPSHNQNNNSNTPLLIVLCIVGTLLVVGIIAGVVAIMGSSKDKEEPKEEKVVEVTETPEEPKATETPAVQPEATVAAAQPEQAPLEDGQPLEQPAQQPVQPAPQVPPAQPVQPVQPAPQLPTQVYYVFPDSGSRIISPAELVGMNEWTASIAKNEIYARYGRMFARNDLDAYFRTQPWYYPTIPADQFNDSYWLNTVEMKNATTIQNYQTSMGFK